MGYPSRPRDLTPSKPAPLCQSAPIRDFCPLISALRVRRLHGRLGGWSPPVGLQNRHQPRGFPRPSRHQSASSLGGRAFHPTFKEIARTDIHSNHHIPRHRPEHISPHLNPTSQRPDKPTRTQPRQPPPHHDGRRSTRLHVARRSQDLGLGAANDSSLSVPCRSRTALGLQTHPRHQEPRLPISRGGQVRGIRLLAHGHSAVS